MFFFFFIFWLFNIFVSSPASSIWHFIYLHRMKSNRKKWNFGFCKNTLNPVTIYNSEPSTKIENKAKKKNNSPKNSIVLLEKNMWWITRRVSNVIQYKYHGIYEAIALRAGRKNWPEHMFHRFRLANTITKDSNRDALQFSADLTLALLVLVFF